MSRSSLIPLHPRLFDYQTTYQVVLPTLTPPTRPSPPPSTPTTTTTILATEALLRKHTVPPSASRSPSTLKRAFTGRKKPISLPNLHAALDSLISESDDPAIVSVLMERIAEQRGSINEVSGVKKPERRRSEGILSSFMEVEMEVRRSRILEKAVEQNREGAMKVLLEAADEESLDEALMIAVQRRKPVMVSLLVGYGANIFRRPGGCNAFLDLVGSVEYLRILETVISPIAALPISAIPRGTIETLSTALETAVALQSLQTILIITRTSVPTSDVLDAVVRTRRPELVLAILLARNPPTVVALEANLLSLFEFHVEEHILVVLLELLLCAGANGDAAAQVLIALSRNGKLEMVELLVKHGASLQYEDAIAIREVVSRGDDKLLDVMIGPGAGIIAPSTASECVLLIPERIDVRCRLRILTILLRKGASGTPLDEALVSVIRQGDEKTAALLLSSTFPTPPCSLPDSPTSVAASSAGTTLSPAVSDPQSPQRKTLHSHATASVDYEDGAAITAAIGAGDLHLLYMLLQAGPATETLRSTFPDTRRLLGAERREAVQSFLISGLPRDIIACEFQREIEQPATRRDNMVLEVLLGAGMGSGGIDGRGAVETAVVKRDRKLLGVILRFVRSEDAACGLKLALDITDQDMRRELVGLLLEGGAEIDKEAVVMGVKKVLAEDNVDVKLLRMLLTTGRADMNVDGGAPLIAAATHSDILLLPLTLKNSTLTRESLTTAITHILCQIPTKATTSHILSLLRQPPGLTPEIASILLAPAVKYYLETPITDRTTSIIVTLLSVGAHLNAPGSLALARAVRTAHMPLTELLLASPSSYSSPPLTPETLAIAFRQAVNIDDPMDRFSFTERLIKAGVLSIEINTALVYCIRRFPDDLGLLRLLSDAADLSGGEALMTGVAMGKVEVVRLLCRGEEGKLDGTRDRALRKAVGIKEKEDRAEICGILLRAGVSKEVVEEVLPSIVTEGDLEMTELLVGKSGSLGKLGGDVVVETAREGNVNMLRILLNNSSLNTASSLEATNKDPQVLIAAFHAATSISSLTLRTEILSLLLSQNLIPTEHLSAELLSATRYHLPGLPLLELLLKHGADPSHDSGAAIAAAVKSADKPALELLLCRRSAGLKHVKPTPETLCSVLKSAWQLARDTRLVVIGWLFEAGMLVDQDVNMTLVKASTLDEGDLVDWELIDLLLSNGADVTWRSCLAITKAAASVNLALLKRFLQAAPPIASDDLTEVCAEAFHFSKRNRWRTWDGWACCELLLKHGAKGPRLGYIFIFANEVGFQDRDLVKAFILGLLQAGVPPDYEDGSVLIPVIQNGDMELLRHLLSVTQNQEFVTAGVIVILEYPIEESVALNCLKLLAAKPGFSSVITRPLIISTPDMPVLARFVHLYPRNTEILSICLGAGAYIDPIIKTQIYGSKPQKVTLLTWALAQPEKEVASSVIELMIHNGADVNFKTPDQHLTPLMLAIKEQRKDIVESLLLANADVNAVDIDGTTPLLLASSLPGPVASEIVSLLLVMSPDVNDGSLHLATSTLNFNTTKLLLEAGHEADFPGAACDGRSALGELCFRGYPYVVRDAEVTTGRLRDMERIVRLLLNHGADPSITVYTIPSQSAVIALKPTVLHSTAPSKLTIFHLALHSPTPLSTLTALLKAGLWKHINAPWTLYAANNLTYSLTMYTQHIRPQDQLTPILLTLLRNNRATDVFYAHSSPQPPGAIGLPEELAEKERQRKAVQDCMSWESTIHSQRLKRATEIAETECRLWQQKIDRERRQQEDVHRQTLSHLSTQRALELQHLAALDAQKLVMYQKEQSHHTTLENLLASRVSREAAAELGRQKSLLAFEERVSRARVNGAKEYSQVLIERQKVTERFERESAEREEERVRGQRGLIREQRALAGELGGVGRRREIGYVTEDVESRG